MGGTAARSARYSAAMSLDTKILSLLEMRDRIGVLSFYVGITPDELANPQPPWQIEIRNGLRTVRQRVREEQPRERWQAVHERLDALEPELAELVDSKAPGRGRALFATVGDGEIRRVTVQVPFLQRVVIDETPFVRPLVAAQDEGRPAGIVVLHRGGLRVLEWRLGEAEDLEAVTFSLGDAQLTGEKSGPAADNPALAQQSVVHRDRFEHRLDENRLRLLRSAGADIAATVQQRGWDRLVVAGEARLRQAFLDAVQPDDGTVVLEDDRLWETEPPHRIAEAAWPTLRSVHRDRERALVERARDRTLGGGPGSLGLPDTLAALNEGRVEHLLFCSQLDASGFRLATGGLLFPQRAAAEASGDEVVEEPLLVERMIERAMATRARITPVDGDPAEMLDELGGVAALLRW